MSIDTLVCFPFIKHIPPTIISLAKQTRINEDTPPETHIILRITNFSSINCSSSQQMVLLNHSYCLYSLLLLENPCFQLFVKVITGGQLLSCTELLSTFFSSTEIARHFRFGSQEDAHEFLRYTIDAMQKACLNGYPK